MPLTRGTLGSNERRLLIKDVTNAHYAPPTGSGPGYLVYARGRTLFAHRFDPATMTLVGSPMAIADNVAIVGGGGLSDFAISGNVLAYRQGTVGTNGAQPVAAAQSAGCVRDA
jgi:hypothetical protein